MSLPLATIADINYLSACKLPTGTYGDSRADYTSGGFCLNAARTGFFIAGQRNVGTIGEFTFPTMVESETWDDLNTCAVPDQNFVGFISGSVRRHPTHTTAHTHTTTHLGTWDARTAAYPTSPTIGDFYRISNAGTIDGTGYTVQDGMMYDDTSTWTRYDALDRIIGLKVYAGKLIVLMTQAYDGAAVNRDNVLVIDDYSALATSDLYGFYEIDGRAHVNNWISPIPSEWQARFGTDHILGAGSGWQIATRNSDGPTLWTVNISDISIGGIAGSINATAAMDFSITNRMINDTYNISRKNYMYNSNSSPTYGFIIPGTRTYFVTGETTDLNPASHIGYKIWDDSPTLLFGPGPYDHTDKHNFYWMFNVDDILDALNGGREVYEIQPYAYGILPTPFQENSSGEPRNYLVNGGYYDPVDNVLYLVLGSSENGYPVIMKYSITDFGV